jgi:hypothetical protein
LVRDGLLNKPSAGISSIRSRATAVTAVARDLYKSASFLMHSFKDQLGRIDSRLAARKTDGRTTGGSQGEIHGAIPGDQRGNVNGRPGTAAKGSR